MGGIKHLLEQRPTDALSLGALPDKQTSDVFAPP
jgi:hypothetical protein